MKQTLIRSALCLSLLALAACAGTATEEDAAGTATTTATTGVETSTLSGGTVDTGPAGPVLTVPENTVEFFETSVGDRVLFDTDSNALDPDDIAILTFQADWLLRYPERTATIEGHADERGTREYNLALGARRAQAVFDYLVSRGVDPSRLTVASLGKERPISLCANEICWSQNRRGVTVIDAGAGF